MRRINPFEYFYVPSARIYGERRVRGFIDWLPPGESLKWRIARSWRARFVEGVPNTFMIDGSNIMPLAVFEASGHLESFTDPAIECPDGKIYRADHLPRASDGYKCPDGSIIAEEGVKEANLMMLLSVGFKESVRGKYNVALRPETAQSIYVNFLEYLKVGLRLPFAIAQIGRAYRNEISPRGSRLREFMQMEIEEFIPPELLNQHPEWDTIKEKRLPILSIEAQEKGEERPVDIRFSDAISKGYIPNVRMAIWLYREYVWLYEDLAIPKELIRFRVIPEDERPFYSGGNVDVEVFYDDDWIEIIGNAYRTNYDLMVHSKHSGVKLSTGDTTPHVVEPSFGLDRITLMVLNIHMDVNPKDRRWPVFRVPRELAPFDVAIASVREDKSSMDMAYKLEAMLRSKGFYVINLASKGRIARQYSLADTLGVPYTITIDKETFENNTITIRERDSKKQQRVNISEIVTLLRRLG